MINTGLLCPKKCGTLQASLPRSIKKPSFEANKVYESRRLQTRKVCRLQEKERSNSRLGGHLETLAEIQPQECQISGDDLDRGLTRPGLMFRMISKPTTVTDNPVTALAPDKLLDGLYLRTSRLLGGASSYPAQPSGRGRI